MRKRRKARVVWLPQDLNNRLGTAPIAATLPSDSATFIATLTANPLGAQPIVSEFPIVKDFALQGTGVAALDSTLADIVETGYRLRRIVGKIGLAVLQGSAQAAGDATSFHVTAGFIVRRVDSAGNSMAGQLSAGSPEASPCALENTMDPWIWRRSWDICDVSASAIALNPNVVAFSPSNYNYGAGIFDGPHIDAKTARVVGPEERLFLSISVEGFDGNAQGAPGAISVIGDFRVLGSMRTNAGNRRNASR